MSVNKIGNSCAKQRRDDVSMESNTDSPTGGVTVPRDRFNKFDEVHVRQSPHLGWKTSHIQTRTAIHHEVLRACRQWSMWPPATCSPKMLKNNHRGELLPCPRYIRSTGMSSILPYARSNCRCLQPEQFSHPHKQALNSVRRCRTAKLSMMTKSPRRW